MSNRFETPNQLASPPSEVVASHERAPAPAKVEITKAAWFDSAIYACLLLFCAALPHSKAVTEIAYTAALVLWLAKLVIRRERPLDQPLTLALLAFLLFSAISTTLGPVPLFNWDRMKSVALLIISVLFAQNVRTLRQVRTLVGLLIVSSMVSLAYTGFLYAYGIGARVVRADPILNSAGIAAQDLVVAVNGHRVHSPATVARRVRQADPNLPLRLQLAREELVGMTRDENVRLQVQLDPRIAKDELLQPGVLAHGRPLRAQGTLGYSVTYAEVLLQIALLIWGLLLAATLTRRKLKWALFAAFILICAALGATLTRASLVSCFASEVIVFWLCIPRAKARVLSIVVLTIAALGMSVIIHRGRGLGMVAPKDAGTEYRVLMWEDGLRLTREHPFFGVGMDTIKAEWNQLGIRAYQRFPLRSHFHSTPIQLAAERGLLTLAAWIWLMVLYLRLLLRLRKCPADWFLRGASLGILAATIGFLSSSLVHYNLGDSEVQMLFWFLMGLAIALNRMLPEAGEQQA
jgi:O-antigen ligase